jgi:hypothetical protein
MGFRGVSGGAIRRRSFVAAIPMGMLAAAGARVAGAQPVAADPVSFYLGQVLALATLQAKAIGRLRPFLAVPAPENVDWQATTTAEAGVVGAVASVLGAMEPPPELTASVGELRLASAAYQTAATAAQRAALGDVSALAGADTGLAEGGGHILLWLDALTAETGNDWGDGLRTLTLGAAPALAGDIEAQLPVEIPADASTGDPGDGVPVEVELEPAVEASPRRGHERDRLKRRDRLDRETAAVS